MALDPTTRACRFVLRMVAELHLRGFQRLRIAPAMSPSGTHWRCAVAPASNILASHGARLARDDGQAAHYGSGMGTRYFGWADATHLYPSQLADRFLAECQDVAWLGQGRDWLYAGWYVEMLGRTYPAALPIAEADYPLPADQLMAVGGTAPVIIPLPPGGE